VNADQALTKHTCNSDRPGMPLPFGRKADLGQCPRCDELRQGAAPRSPGWVGELGQRARDDQQRSAEIRAHFAPDGPHDPKTCGPVCTFADW